MRWGDMPAVSGRRLVSPTWASHLSPRTMAFTSTVRFCFVVREWVAEGGGVWLSNYFILAEDV